MRQSLRFMIAACFCLVASQSVGQDTPKTAPGVETELKQVYADNLKTTEAEDVDATMKTIHPKSPMYESTKQGITQLFGKGLNAKYKMLAFKHLATDGEYAVTRVRQRTTRTPPENFKNNEVEMVLIFRKDNGTWKVWTQAILEIEFINE